MPSNFCRNVVVLFKRNLLTGDKEVYKLTSSRKLAVYIRGLHAKEALKAQVKLQDLYPIEFWPVMNPSDYPAYQGKVWENTPNKVNYKNNKSKV